MKSHDTVAYNPPDSGYVVCPECTPESKKDIWHPVFADSEWDYYPSCDKCLRTIDDVSLTSYGRNYEKHLKDNPINLFGIFKEQNLPITYTCGHRRYVTCKSYKPLEFKAFIKWADAQRKRPCPDCAPRYKSGTVEKYGWPKRALPPNEHDTGMTDADLPFKYGNPRGGAMKNPKFPYTIKGMQLRNKAGVSASLLRDVASTVGSIYSMNAPGAKGYVFNATDDGKKIYRGMYLDYDYEKKGWEYYLDYKSGILEKLSGEVVHWNPMKNPARYYVDWSSWFDSHPYDTVKIKKAIKRADGFNIRESYNYGLSNQPKVVTFDSNRGNVKNIQISIEKALGTPWIIIREKTWRNPLINPTTTMQAVREANEMWFSPKNKKFFQDVSYRVLHSSSGQPYLVRSTYAWSDMFGGQKRLHWRINAIDRDLKIGTLLKKEFATLEDVKEWLQS